MGQWLIVAQVVVARSATERFGLNDILCITVDVEAHVASVEQDDGFQLRGCVVHHHIFLIDAVGGGRSLLGADFVERDKHGGVDGARDAEKGACDALRARDAAFLKFRCGCGVGRVFHPGPIRR